MATLDAGSAENVVPDAAAVVLAGTEAGLAAAKRVLSDFWDGNIAWEQADDGQRSDSRARSPGASAAASAAFGTSTAMNGTVDWSSTAVSPATAPVATDHTANQAAPKRYMTATPPRHATKRAPAPRSCHLDHSAPAASAANENPTR